MSGVRIHSRTSGSQSRIDLLMEHPMESGQRTDSNGTRIPAWHLVEVALWYNDTKLAEVELGPGLSSNPALSFSLRNVEKGGTLTVRWRDNRDHSGEKNAALA